MSPTQFGVLVGVVSVLAAVIGVYFLAKANERENARQRQAANDKAVKDATDPLRDQLTTANQQILRRDRALERAQSRIEELEDELRRTR